MSRMLSVIAGTSLLALAGAANAGEPIALSNSDMDAVSAGGSYSIYQSIKFNAVIVPIVYGNTATSNAYADASGWNTYTDTQTSAVTTTYW